MLPNKALAPVYEDVIWCYVFRDFSGSERDRAAERIELRLGVTSYPQIFLADPMSFEILEHTGRQVESFLVAVTASLDRVVTQQVEFATEWVLGAQVLMAEQDVSAPVP